MNQTIRAGGGDPAWDDGTADAAYDATAELAPDGDDGDDEEMEDAPDPWASSLPDGWDTRTFDDDDDDDDDTPGDDKMLADDAQMFPQAAPQAPAAPPVVAALPPALAARGAAHTPIIGNLLDDVLAALAAHHRSYDAVQWVGVYDFEHERMVWVDWRRFAKQASTVYYLDRYRAHEHGPVIVGDGWWLERAWAIDAGAEQEWWAYHVIPRRLAGDIDAPELPGPGMANRVHIGEGPTTLALRDYASAQARERAEATVTVQHGDRVTFKTVFGGMEERRVWLIMTNRGGWLQVCTQRDYARAKRGEAPVVEWRTTSGLVQVTRADGTLGWRSPTLPTLPALPTADGAGVTQDLLWQTADADE